jgi:hypothetical protein
VYGGQTYIAFAPTHRGYFEVVLRPHLYRRDEPDLVVAKDAAFQVRYGSARANLETHRPEAVTDEDVRGLGVAGWLASHGFATLALTANLAQHLDGEPDALAAHVNRGIITMGELAQRAASGPPAWYEDRREVAAFGRALVEAEACGHGHGVIDYLEHPVSCTIKHQIWRDVGQPDGPGHPRFNELIGRYAATPPAPPSPAGNG